MAPSAPWAWAVLAVALLASCTLGPALPPPDLGAYRVFLVEDAAPVLDATGAVSFNYKGSTESGELFVRTTPQGATWVQLKARVTGSLALDVRFDPQRLLLIDYANKSYVEEANTPALRLDLMGIDMTPEEFRMVLTARVPRRDFERGGGTLISPHQASFQRDGDRYVFTLGEDGLPTSWVKQRNQEIRFRVEYRGYLEVPSQGGPPVRLPERTRVFVEGGKPVLVLGVREFSVPAQAPALSFALPAEAAAFRRE